jgi:hypothetical protein
MMKLPDVSEWGRCPCGGTYQSRQVLVTMAADRAEKLELRNIRQGLCPACGSRVYKTVTLELLEALTLEQPTPTPRAVPGG